MAVALKDRPVLTFPAPPGVTMASWDSGCGTVTDAFKPGQLPGASAPIGGAGRGPAPPAATPARGRRRRAPAPAARQWRASTRTPGAGCIERAAASETSAMSAESDALNEQIKQSVALLRRHL